MHTRAVHRHVTRVHESLLAAVQRQLHHAVRDDAVPDADGSVEVGFDARREVDGADDGAGGVVEGGLWRTHQQLVWG